MIPTLSEETIIGIAPFFIVLFMFFIPISPSIKSVLLALTLLSILLTPYYRKHLSTAFNTMWGRAGLAFFLYVVLACLWSDAPYLMRLGVVDKYSKLVFLPILAVGFINPKTRTWAFNSYFAAMLVTCVVSVLKVLGYRAINLEDPGEVFYNHIATGFMVALAVYFAGILSFQKNISKWQRAYYFLMIAVGSYQIFFLNAGRTGYVVYGILMSMLIIQKFSFKKAIIGLLLFASAMVMIYSLSPLMQKRTWALVSDIRFFQHHEENTSLGFRLQFHQYAQGIFEQHPIIGIGTGGFKHRFMKEKPIAAWGDELNDPHSQYWLTLAEQGLIGLAFLMIFLGTLLVTAFQLKESRPILLGMLVAFCMGCVSDTILCYSTAGTLLIMFSALCFGELIEKSMVKEKVKKDIASSSALAA